MKLNLKVLFMALAALGLAGCAEVLTAVTEPIRNMRITVNNTLPGPLGYVGTAETKVSIFNPQIFYAKIFANDQKDSVCVIAPGESVFDEWHLNFNQSVMSLVAVFYRDPACTEWVGMSMTVLHLSKGGSFSWTLDQVTYPDDATRWRTSYYGVPVYPLALSGESRRVSFPDLYLVGMNIVMIPNCTNYVVSVRINGINKAYVYPGQIYRLKTVEMYHDTNLNIQLVFVDNRRLLYGYKELDGIDLVVNGPSAWQYMTRVGEIQRASY